MGELAKGERTTSAHINNTSAQLTVCGGVHFLLLFFHVVHVCCVSVFVGNADPVSRI